jgi:tetratricopeptide (TPR) repeat protein
VSLSQRARIAQTLHRVWNYYFNINEKKDLALSIGGIFFDLGFYNEALIYFQYSTDEYGIEIDTYYNKILCFYQLRQDKLFLKALEEAKQLFPGSDIFKKLHQLDLSS